MDVELFWRIVEGTWEPEEIAALRDWAAEIERLEFERAARERADRLANSGVLKRVSMYTGKVV